MIKKYQTYDNFKLGDGDKKLTQLRFEVNQKYNMVNEIKTFEIQQIKLLESPQFTNYCQRITTSQITLPHV